MASYDPERHGPRVLGPGFRTRVLAVVRTVPEGRVTTYGDVAAALGWRRAARRVGQALSGLPADAADVPWHRVVAAGGRIACGAEQERRLRLEGVPVTRSGRVQAFDALRFFPSRARAD